MMTASPVRSLQQAGHESSLWLPSSSPSFGEYPTTSYSGSSLSREDGAALPSGRHKSNPTNSLASRPSKTVQSAPLEPDVGDDPFFGSSLALHSDRDRTDVNSFCSTNTLALGPFSNFQRSQTLASIPPLEESTQPSVDDASSRPQNLAKRTRTDADHDDLASPILGKKRSTPYQKARASEDSSKEAASPNLSPSFISIDVSQRPATSTGHRRLSYSSSMPSARPFASSTAGLVKLPLKLPRPQLQILSDPYKDLNLHLRRHGLYTEAQTFAQAKIPTDYILHAYMTAMCGPTGLFEQTSQFLSRQQEEVARQMARSELQREKTDPCAKLPEALLLDVDTLDQAAEKDGVTPTHVFAIHPCTTTNKTDGETAASSSSSSKSPRKDGMLLPIHAMPYVLQCASLPALPSITPSTTTGIKEVPIVSLKVPQPQDFPLTHRFIYDHDATELMCNLLPISWITSTLNRENALNVNEGGDSRQDDQTSQQQQPEDLEQSSSRSSSLATSDPIVASSPETEPHPSNFTVAHTVHTLSQLQVIDLLRHAQTIQACWANGVAIGLLSELYWQTLDRAWNLVIASLKKKMGMTLVKGQ